MHLVVLPPAEPFSKIQNPAATKTALEMLNNRGDQPRLKRNRMLFLAADSEATARLDDLICSFKAWESIVLDFDKGDLNLDRPQSTQARNSCVSASDAANRAIREAYKWLLAPTEEVNAKGFPEMRWEQFALSTGAGSFTKEIERVMTEHGLLIERWAPIHLEKLLRTWFWKDGAQDASAQDVWQKTCQYLYMPRLKDSNVFAATVSEGTGSRDFFGLAQGKREGKYVGFTFGQRAIVHLETNLLIEPDAAAAHEAEVRAADEAKRKADEAQAPPKPGEPTKPPTPSAGPPTKRVNRRFYGTVDLNPLLAKKQFAEIIDEVVQNFTTRPNDIVSIVVDIQAVAPAGFDDATQRAVKENCNALKFRASGFEPGE